MHKDRKERAMGGKKTTNRHAQANLETKRKALEQVDAKLRPGKRPRWKVDADLLAWVDSL